MTHYSIDIKNFGIKAYDTEATAKVMANGCLIFSNIDEMLDNPNVTLTTFANMFNANSPAKVKRFADKKTAAKRLSFFKKILYNVDKIRDTIYVKY